MWHFSDPQTNPWDGGSVEANTALSYLASPFYPVKYFRNNKQGWVIQAPKFSIITIEVIWLVIVLIRSTTYGRWCCYGV